MKGHRKLSESERLKIWRSRLGISQRAAAKKLKLTRDCYARCERSERQVVDYELIIPSEAPKLLKELTAGERCRVYRWRAGNRSQQQVATEMNVSRVTLNRMEMDKADATDLLCYWES